MTKFTYKAWRYLAYAVCGTLIGSTAMATAEPVKLNYAIGLPPSSAPAASAKDFADAARAASGGDVSVEVFPMTLLNLQESLSGLRDGMADLAAVFPSIVPEAAELPIVLLLGEVNFPPNEKLEGPARAFAYVGAMLDYVMTKCPRCLNEYKKQNQLPLAGSAAKYSMLCAKPVRAPEDFRGLRYHASLPSLQRFVESLGGVRVRMTTNEVYEAFGQGLIDCTVLGTTELKALRLSEVVKYVNVEVPNLFGVFSGNSNINIDAWKSLNASQKTAILKAAAAASTSFPWVQYQNGVVGVEEAKGRNIEFVQPTDELVQAANAFAKADGDTIVSLYEKKYGVTEVARIVQEYGDVYRKWEKLFVGVNTAEAAREIFWNELYSKVDVATYGND